MRKKTINQIEILHFDCVDSTNNIAKQYEDKKHLLTIVSDTQTGGKGRMGRSFFSYQGGLYMSVILEPTMINIPYHLCTPAAALAVQKTLNSIGVENVSIKWVNDIITEKRKVCGILTECKTVNNEIERIVVGIGINLCENDISFPEDIQDKAGVVNTVKDKIEIASTIVNLLSDYLQTEAHNIVAEYTKNLAFIGQTVTATDYADNNKKITGKALGVNSDCYLLLELPNGQIKTLCSGELI